MQCRSSKAVILRRASVRIIRLREELDAIRRAIRDVHPGLKMEDLEGMSGSELLELCALGLMGEPSSLRTVYPGCDQEDFSITATRLA